MVWRRGLCASAAATVVVVEIGVCVDPVVVVVELPGVVDSVESEVQAAAPRINSASANTTPPASADLFLTLVNRTVPPFPAKPQPLPAVCRQICVPLESSQ